MNEFEKLKEDTDQNRYKKFLEQQAKDEWGEEEVSFGKSVTEIGENAFEKCYDLSVIRFTEDSCLETIGDNVFLKCNSLSDITIPNSVNSIGQDAFTSCPIKVATLPVYAVSFINKDKLTSLVITDGISIADNEFQDCKNLESVVLPDDLTEIGDQAFDNCIKLESKYPT